MRLPMNLLKQSGLLALAVLLVPCLGFAQYTVTELDSNQTAIGSNPIDPPLVNAWGITSGPATPFWVSDNGTGKSTLYNGAGVLQSLIVTVPLGGGAAGLGLPTGVIFNTASSSSFVLSTKVGSVTHTGKALFLFATQDGTISGFIGGGVNTAIIGVDHSTSGASYTALTIFTNSTGKSFLYVPNNIKGGGVDIFDSSFNMIGSYVDPDIPRDFAPYGIRVINGQLWVTYSSTKKAASGFVDVFQIEDDGSLVERFQATGPLHSPWGLALAPSNFGEFSDAVLIANNIKNGEINAFDASNGRFLGSLRDGPGGPIKINQLWGIEFGKGGGPNGTTSQLFFTAGPDDYANGLFGVINPAP